MWKTLKIAIFYTFFIIIFACPPNCNHCQNFICKACSQKYSLTIEGRCIFSQQSRCAYFNQDNQCIRCEPSYILIESTCQKDYSGCISFENFICNKCGFGKQLKNQSCVGILNCKKYDNNGNCVQCREGFRLDSICIDQSPQCIISDESSGVCILCNDNYKLNGYQCLLQNKKPLNCYIYNKQNQCLTCKPGYIFNRRKQCSITGNSICRQFQSNGNCLQCNRNNLVNINGTCIIKNCIKGNADNCLQCQNGFQLNNGVCLLVQQNCLVLFNDGSNRCSQCKPRYFNNINGSCSALPKDCEAVNIFSFTCINCRIGFLLNSLNNCVPPLRINNCQTVIQSTGQCRNCSFGYFLKQNQCFKVSSLCNGYDRTNGLCLSCITGYSNIGGECRDPNCLTKEKDYCVKCRPNFLVDSLIGLCKYSDSNCQVLRLLGCDVCKQGYYLQLNICKQLPPFCITYRNGACLMCKDGFSLRDKICVVPLKNCQSYDFSNSMSYCKHCEFGFTLTNEGLCIKLMVQNAVITQRDRNCLKYNNTICIQCSHRYYSQNNLCVPVNNQCNRYNQTNGACITCYLGYIIRSGNCIPQGNQVDQFCKSFQNNICKECYSGFYINSKSGLCVANNPFCRVSNEVTGDCVSCFQGYYPSQGKCIPTSIDPNCVKFDQNQTCIRCSSRFFMKNGLCSPVSPLCRTFNVTIGICLSCYQGYSLHQGNCKIENALQNIYCRLKNNNNICVQCYPNYYLSINQICVLVNILCRTYNQSQGHCLSCYPGYILKEGNCQISSSNEIDQNCIRFNQNKECVQCYVSFYIRNGFCKRVNQLCKSHDNQNGRCLSCYPGYDLTINGECAIPSVSISLSSNDPYCTKFDNRLCVQCREQFFFDGQRCSQASTLCRTYNLSNGHCTSCYQGYILNPPSCQLPAEVQIPFCSFIRNGSCAKCLQGYYIQQANKCSPVSILCATYHENNGSCITCISGYFWQQGQCIYPSMGFDKYCINYDVSAYCTKCLEGYYILNYLCTKIDQNCINFNHAQSRCLECKDNKTPNNAKCS